jgi:hypothetical protein
MQNLVEKLPAKWPLGKPKKQNNVNMEVMRTGSGWN